MKIAIQTAKIAYPDYERESGTKWPDKQLDPAESQLFAFAALRALDGRVLTSSRKISPMQTGPKGEKRPPRSSANAVSSHFVEGRFKRSKAGAGKDPASGPNFRG